MNDIEIAKNINILSREIRSYYREKLRKFNINDNQYLYLIYLYRAKGDVCQEDLVHHFNIDKAAVARAVKHLIDEGYIRKEHSDKDRRLFFLYLTDKAHMIRDEFFSILQSSNEVLLTSLDEAEIVQLNRLLRKIDYRNR